MRDVCKLLCGLALAASAGIACKHDDPATGNSGAAGNGGESGHGNATGGRDRTNGGAGSNGESGRYAGSHAGAAEAGVGGSGETVLCGIERVPAPMDCTTGPCASPVCGKDGRTYANLCEILSSSTTPDSFGHCSAPSGYFACATVFCRAGVEFCTHAVGYGDSGTCYPLPASCMSGSTPTCGCVKNPGNAHGCGEKDCTLDASGNMTMSCQWP